MCASDELFLIENEQEQTEAWSMSAITLGKGSLTDILRDAQCESGFKNNFILSMIMLFIMEFHFWTGITSNR